MLFGGRNRVEASVKRISTTWIWAGATAMLLASAGCGAGSGNAAAPTGDGTAAALSGEVKVDGSSTVFPISEAVGEDFGLEHSAVRVMVGESGTGGGFKKFGAGEVDVTGASRPIKPSEVELCQKNGIEYIEIPVAYDGLAIVVNPKNTWASSITVEELKSLWAPEAQAKVTKWSQVRPGWPDKEIHLFGPGVDSGTYDYFTQAIVGKEHSSRGDYTSSEDDNVLVQGVAGDEYALGFFGLAYFESNVERLKLVPVDDGKSDNGSGPIAPSQDTVRTGQYQPLSRPIFIYVSKKSLDKPQVAAFVKYYLTHAATLSKEVGYIPLPDEAYALVQQRAEQKVTGSIFGGKGSQVGVKIEDLLKAEQGK